MESQPTDNTWDKIKSLFNRKKLEPAAQPEPQPQPAPATLQEEKQTEWFSIYGHGFHNGLYRIPQIEDAFPEFLEKSSELERIEIHKAIVEAEIQKLTITLDEDERKFTTWNQEKIEAEVASISAKEKLNNLKERRNYYENRNKELHTLREAIKPEYDWLPALLFLTAGILFIVGDVSITTDITTNGFQMNRSEGRWFAIGLAMVSFIIKPLFDRVFEKPFQRARIDPNKAYKTLLYIVTGLGLVMLMLLGKFRAESFSSLVQLKEIEGQMNQPDITSEQSVILQQQIAALSKEMGDNDWGQYGLILSTIVFAIGGAMCLSVAFPSLKQLMNRYWFIPCRRSFYNSMLKAKTKKIDHLQQSSDQIESKKLLATKNLELLNLVELREQLSDAKSKLSEWLNEYYNTKKGKEKSLYTDGYLRGEKYSMEGDLKFKVIDPLSQTGAAKSGKEDAAAGEARKYTRRPFVKIRKMIADNYNQKQNTAAKDETEFEILG